MENAVNPTYVSEGRNKFVLNEDWVVVVLGFLIIILAVGGIRLIAPVYNWSNGTELLNKVLTASNVKWMVYQFLFVFVIALAGSSLTGRAVRSFIVVFPCIYIITIVAIILAGNQHVKAFNLEAVIFSLSFGLIIGNLYKLPGWVRTVLTTELFVKIGLILLGTSIIFADILKAGAFGLLQAIIVVLSVWYFAYWVCKKLNIDNELTMMIASAVSICGVSAAIATAGAIKGDTKKLSYVISLVLITAIPMMIGMPYIAKYMGLSQEVTGAWLGGTIDTTGAVVASGTLVGETALKVSTIVKFSQNVLLGLAAFAISIYWTYAKSTNANTQNNKPTLRVIWDRFPKFVLGFIGASLLFSFFLSSEKISEVKDGIKNLQGLWFALAFTTIGLETNFSELLATSNRRPFYAFVIAQCFNILITLLIAFALFNNTEV